MTCLLTLPAGGCGKLYPVSQSLAGAPPHVVTLQLVWESHHQEPAAIAATMRAVGEEVGWPLLCRAIGGHFSPPVYRSRNNVLAGNVFNGR